MTAKTEEQGRERERQHHGARHRDCTRSAVTVRGDGQCSGKEHTNVTEKCRQTLVQQDCGAGYDRRRTQNDGNKQTEARKWTEATKGRETKGNEGNTSIGDEKRNRQRKRYKAERSHWQQRTTAHSAKVCTPYSSSPSSLITCGFEGEAAPNFMGL